MQEHQVLLAAVGFQELAYTVEHLVAGGHCRQGHVGPLAARWSQLRPRTNPPPSSPRPSAPQRSARSARSSQLRSRPRPSGVGVVRDDGNNSSNVTGFAGRPPGPASRAFPAPRPRFCGLSRSSRPHRMGRPPEPVPDRFEELLIRPDPVGHGREAGDVHPDGLVVGRRSGHGGGRSLTPNSRASSASISRRAPAQRSLPSGPDMSSQLVGKMPWCPPTATAAFWATDFEIGRPAPPGTASCIGQHLRADRRRAACCRAERSRTGSEPAASSVRPSCLAVLEARRHLADVVRPGPERQPRAGRVLVRPARAGP